MNKEQKQAIIKEYARKEGDVGSTEVQTAILTARIKELTEHMKVNKKDHSTRRGLIRHVNKRKSLMAYLKRKDHARYIEQCKRLGLRH